MSHGDDTPGRRFADLIKAARLRARMTQEDLADEAGVGRYTVIRWESGKTVHPEADAVRKVISVIGLDPREVPVALGYVTREEMGLPPEPTHNVDPAYADVIDLLSDPNVPARDKLEAAEYLRWRYRRSQSGAEAGKGVRRGTTKEAATGGPPRG